MGGRMMTELDGTAGVRPSSRRSARWAAALLGGSLVIAGALAGSALSAAVPAAAAAAPNPPSSTLSSVFCTSADNCLAVGSVDFKGAVRNVVEHWNGQKWAPVTAPNPAGLASDDRSELVAVRCASAASCWAVGSYESSGAPTLNQILHWNGRKWQLTPAPSPAGTSKIAFSSLSDVSCVSAADCWAVGRDGQNAENSPKLNEALHWNGTRWRLVKVPNPGGTSGVRLNGLTSVRCASTADCWAAGSAGSIRPDSEVLRNELLHWNGRKWTTVTAPNPAGTAAGDLNSINGLSCISAADCWAAGSAGRLNTNAEPGHQVNQILHWNGTRWRLVKVPNPDGTGPGVSNQLGGITCFSAKDCWAVGDSGGGPGKSGINTALHWSGSTWSVISTPEPAGTGAGDRNFLASVRCTSFDNCWAVGFLQPSSGPDLNQFLHWTGRKWFKD
jgi:hypothetical protein